MGIINPALLPALEPKRGWHGRFFHSDHMTFAYYEIDAGAAVPPHEHPNEEVWNVVAGTVELTLGSQAYRVIAGQAAVVPAGTLHAVTAIEPARVIVVDHPRRTAIGEVKI